ncbi:threonine ammonia-lyase [Amycolatopsis pithecellobii]|uniref:Pyridoxal-phosphate dependent enzyme n=1 Tax=Amycolatopsis pithecellobii TaxID=664692 RepID=A0A6N7YXG1_9PSEU|nr:pyridoxal-phosphate dependent enzyme [Amycolatopsis pithecellobii]MTD56568.1 pyridoxal-phosphate dependent enzyme [Amycolatopsis pithecellobii]
MIDVDEIAAISARISEYVIRTPTVTSAGLSTLFGVPTVLKLESLQRTGSFKARGVAAKLSILSPVERARGVVAVSGGNHAIAVSVMARQLGINATVVMPLSAPARAIAIAKAAGAELHVAGDVAEAFALMNELERGGLTVIHPFADPVVLAGQGTAGLEMADAAPQLTDVLVSIGGGALISGVAVAVRGVLPGVRVWGVELEGADGMTRALNAGGPVTFTPTSSISTLSPPMVSQIAYDHVSSLVEDILVFTDDQAISGTLDLAEHGKVWAEPAAGCLVPAAHEIAARVGQECRLGLLICGGNVDVSDFASWAARAGD